MRARLRSMKPRTKGLSPEDFVREAKRIRQKIEEMMDAQARDPALQDLQSWMRERRGELFRWTESPDIPAENNHAERGVRGLVVARKTSCGARGSARPLREDRQQGASARLPVPEVHADETSWKADYEAALRYAGCGLIRRHIGAFDSGGECRRLRCAKHWRSGSGAPLSTIGVSTHAVH